MCSSSVGNIPEQIQYKQRRLYFAVFAGNFLQDMVLTWGSKNEQLNQNAIQSNHPKDTHKTSLDLFRSRNIVRVYLGLSDTWLYDCETTSDRSASNVKRMR